MSPTLE